MSEADKDAARRNIEKAAFLEFRLVHPQSAELIRQGLGAIGYTNMVERRKKLPEFLKTKRRPIDRKFVRSIFERDHPGTADDHVIEAFAEHILQLDDSIPNGTYIDMCNHLPVVDPTKIVVPTIIMRGEYDGIAGFKDLLNFFEALPNPDKQFAVMPGIAHASFQQKNFAIAYHILLAFFTQPDPIYKEHA